MTIRIRRKRRSEEEEDDDDDGKCETNDLFLLLRRYIYIMDNDKNVLKFRLKLWLTQNQVLKFRSLNLANERPITIFFNLACDCATVSKNQTKKQEATLGRTWETETRRILIEIRSIIYFKNWFHKCVFFMLGQFKEEE